MIKRHYLIQFWLLMLVILGGLVTLFMHFDDHQKQAHIFVNQVKNKPKHPAEQLPSFKPLDQFNYPESEVRPSPFQLRKTQIATIARPDASRPQEPLEAYPLEALKFTGVLEEGMRRWALIKLPDGNVTRIKVGEYMGQNDGKVVAVSENSLIIEEQVWEEKAWVKRKVTLQLGGMNPRPNTSSKEPSHNHKAVKVKPLS